MAGKNKKQEKNKKKQKKDKNKKDKKSEQKSRNKKEDKQKKKLEKKQKKDRKRLDSKDKRNKKKPAKNEKKQNLKKPDKQDIKKGKKSLKRFLSMDFIERMIRVEQEVASSFGEKLKYNETEQYNSLSEEEKKAFDKYITNREKGKGKKTLSVLGLLAIAGIGFSVFQRGKKGEFNSNAGVTGYMINTGNDIGLNLSSSLGILFSFLLVGGALLLVSLGTLRMMNKKHSKRLQEHKSVIDNIVNKKYSVK